MWIPWYSNLNIGVTEPSLARLGPKTDQIGKDQAIKHWVSSGSMWTFCVSILNHSPAGNRHQKGGLLL